jgi:hypothetical protein
MNGSWPQILFVLLLVVAPAIKQIVEGLERKKQARALDQQRNRREMDELRTGSVAPAEKATPSSQYQQSGQVNAADRLREIQAKRREALERARKQAQTGLGIATGVVVGTQATPSRPTARPTPSTPRPPARGPRPTGPTAGPLIGGRAPLPSRQPTRPAVPQPPRQQASSQRSQPRTPTQPLSPLHAPPARRTRAQHARQGSHTTVHRLVQDAEEGVKIRESHAAVSPGELASMSRNAWRKAMVLQELLAPPIALREQDSTL